jgi:hypothetical protein
MSSFHDEKICIVRPGSPVVVTFSLVNDGGQKIRLWCPDEDRGEGRRSIKTLVKWLGLGVEIVRLYVNHRFRTSEQYRFLRIVESSE